MSHNPHYTRYHPRWYRTRMPIFWWVRKWTHVRFILRELTCMGVAFYAFVLLFHIRAVSLGPEAYADFLALLKTSGSIVLHAVAFVLVIFHSVTWFNLAPKAMVFRIGSTRIANMVIVALNYMAWGIFSVAIAWILLTD